jgi:YVTN family beta-propeller protein
MRPHHRIGMVVFASALVLSACATSPVATRPASEEEGTLLVYLQPFPPEAGRIRFTLERVSAVREDGTETALPLALTEFRGADPRRQRLVASGPVAAGEYAGLSVLVKRASLRREDGDASLLVPDVPVRIDLSFKAVRKKSLVLSLAFNYDASIGKGFLFSPVFSAVIPDRPVLGATGYVTNFASDTITIFDKKTMQVAGTIATGHGPRMAAIDQVRSRAYVVVSADDAVEVVDMAQGDIISRVRLSTGDDPRELALTPDGTVLMTANYGSNTASIIDPISLVELARIAVGQGPGSVLIDRSGRRAYVFNTLSSSITVIDVQNRSKIATISTEPEPLRGDFNRKGDRLTIIFARSPYIVVLDTVSLTAVRREFVGAGVSTVKIDPRTDFLILGKDREATIAVYDPFSYTPADVIPVGGGAAHLGIDGDENNLYVAVPERKAVRVVSLVSRRIIGEIEVSDSPSWVVVMGER